jgi:hypothetical protein
VRVRFLLTFVSGNPPWGIGDSARKKGRRGMGREEKRKAEEQDKREELEGKK